MTRRRKATQTKYARLVWRMGAVAGDVVDARLRLEVLLQAIRLVLGEEPRRRYDRSTVGGDVLLQIPVVDRVAGAALDAVGKRAGPRHVWAEVALHDRALLHRHLMLGRVIRQVGLRRHRRRAPVEEAPVVGAGGHADPAADAAVLVDQHRPFRSGEGRPHRADVHAGWVLALLARRRNELRALSRELRLEHLDPLHGLGGEMPLDAGGSALRWLADALAAVAGAEVDDHRPLADAAVQRARCCGVRPRGRGASQRRLENARQHRQGDEAKRTEAKDAQEAPAVDLPARGLTRGREGIAAAGPFAHLFDAPALSALVEPRFP